MRDIMNNIHPTGIAATGVITVTDNTAVVSGIVDRQGFDALAFLIASGTLADADATFTVLVEDGDESDLSDAAAVDDAYLNGTEALASFTFAEDASVFKIGYVGPKRYVRCTVTPAANTGSAPLAIIGLLGNPASAATDNPPQ
jgi:hypothetical protein